MVMKVKNEGGFSYLLDSPTICFEPPYYACVLALLNSVKSLNYLIVLCHKFLMFHIIFKESIKDALTGNDHVSIFSIESPNYLTVL